MTTGEKQAAFQHPTPLLISLDQDIIQWRICNNHFHYSNVLWRNKHQL